MPSNVYNFARVRFQIARALLYSNHYCVNISGNTLNNALRLTISPGCVYYIAGKRCVTFAPASGPVLPQHHSIAGVDVLALNAAEELAVMQMPEQDFAIEQSIAVFLRSATAAQLRALGYGLASAMVQQSGAKSREICKQTVLSHGVEVGWKMCKSTREWKMNGID